MSLPVLAVLAVNAAVAIMRSSDSEANPPRAQEELR